VSLVSSTLLQRSVRPAGGPHTLKAPIVPSVVEPVAWHLWDSMVGLLGWEARLTPPRPGTVPSVRLYFLVKWLCDYWDGGLQHEQASRVHDAGQPIPKHFSVGSCFCFCYCSLPSSTHDYFPRVCNRPLIPSSRSDLTILAANCLALFGRVVTRAATPS